MSIRCIFGHKYQVLHSMVPGMRIVCCTRCKKRWLMDDETFTFLPYTEDLQNIVESAYGEDYA